MVNELQDVQLNTDYQVTVENTRGILATVFAFKEFKTLYRSRAFWAKEIACAQVTRKEEQKRPSMVAVS